MFLNYSYDKKKPHVNPGISRDNICHIVEAPADVPENIKKSAIDVARKAVSSLEGAGVFAVELFLTKDGKVFFSFPLCMILAFTLLLLDPCGFAVPRLFFFTLAFRIQ